MSTIASQHLTEDQLASLLAGETPSPSVQDHLQACAPCQRELDELQVSIDTFKDLSLQWAVAEAPRRVPVPSRWALRLGVRPAWTLGLAGSAVACLLVFGLQLPFTQAHHAPAVTSVAVASPAAPNPSNAELAEDNRLMQSIDQELRVQAEARPAVPVADLRTSGHDPDSHLAGTVTNE